MGDNELDWLQRWYLSQCDGDWEHGYGLDIGTLDNPGWRLRINLVGTELEARPFERLEHHRGEHDWTVCWVEDNQFHAACGPLNLTKTVGIFRNWVGSVHSTVPIDTFLADDFLIWTGASGATYRYWFLDDLSPDAIRDGPGNYMIVASGESGWIPVSIGHTESLRAWLASEGQTAETARQATKRMMGHLTPEGLQARLDEWRDLGALVNGPGNTPHLR